MRWSVTAVPYRAKARPLRPRRSCFGPAGAAPKSTLSERTGPTAMGLYADAARVEPPGTAPGSDRFITTSVYRHSRPLRDGTPNIGGQGLRRKAGGGNPMTRRACLSRAGREIMFHVKHFLYLGIYARNAWDESRANSGRGSAENGANNRDVRPKTGTKATKRVWRRERSRTWPRHARGAWRGVAFPRFPDDLHLPGEVRLPAGSCVAGTLETLPSS